MRHPLHFGTTAQILGLAFLAPIWPGLPAARSAIMLTLYTDRFEDLVRLKEIGRAYERYYVRTWDIVDMVVRKHQPELIPAANQTNEEK